jgi:hypothetical protein
MAPSRSIYETASCRVFRVFPSLSLGGHTLGFDLGRFSPISPITLHERPCEIGSQQRSASSLQKLNIAYHAVLVAVLACLATYSYGFGCESMMLSGAHTLTSNE